MSAEDETPFPNLTRASTTALHSLNRSHLSPADANISPPSRALDVDGTVERGLRMRRVNATSRSGSRRRKRSWKKLMWVKQSYPDNYTDQATFLENLQRNPRLKPYDFWPLFADSTVILQHVCSVIIFVVCFVAIFQERVSPVSVVSWSSVGTFLGWLLWERWVSEEEDEEEKLAAAAAAAASGAPGVAIGTHGAGGAMAGAMSIARTGSLRRRNRAGSLRRPLPPLPTESMTSLPTSANTSAASSTTNLVMSAPKPPPTSSTSTPSTATAGTTPTASGSTDTTTNGSKYTTPSTIPKVTINEQIQYPDAIPGEESRTNQRLATIKSALLIYSTLLGLSPILKSLTLSTSSDSIWAISFWLLVINMFFFDYSGGVGAKFPASLSTNAALMASTVLASRLPSTQQVFSLTVFSIEVFGLFPVFRRHVRHRSWKYHITLTTLLVLGAGSGVGMVVQSDGQSKGWPWKGGLVGMVVGSILSLVAAGGCSWWLIGLQKYKNEIRGPWDPARPIIMSRPRWE